MAGQPSTLLQDAVTEDQVQKLILDRVMSRIEGREDQGEDDGKPSET